MVPSSTYRKFEDPMYLAEVEIERYALEKEEFRLTVDAAQKYADAFGQSLPEFLDELSRRVGALRGRGSCRFCV